MTGPPRQSSWNREHHRTFGFLRYASLAVPLLLLCLAASPTAEAGATPPAPAPACSAGEALQNLGRLNAAEAAFLGDLKTEKGVECAPKKLDEIGRRDSKCTRADALAAASQKAGAEKAYEKVLEAAPSSECAETGLSKATGKSGRESFESFSSHLGSILTAAILPFACALAIAFLFLLTLARCKRTENSAFIFKFLPPTLQVGELDAAWMDHSLGPQFSSLVRTELEPEPSGNLTMVTGHSGFTDALESVKEISEAKGAVAVLTFFLTLLRRSYEVSGALQPAGEDGAGVTIELTRDKHDVAEVALWGKEFGIPAGAEPKDEEDAKAFQALAIPTAAWIDHEIASAVGKLGSLPSADAKSWALFKAGAELQARGLSKQAVDLYKAALAIDAENGPALANLGLLRASEGNYPESERLLKRALNRMRNSQSSPDWYRAKMNLARTYGNWAAQGDAATKILDARRTARDLVLSAEAAISSGKPDRPTTRFLERIVPAALAIYAGTDTDAVQSTDPEASDQGDVDVFAQLKKDALTPEDARRYLYDRRETLPPLAAYNLACAEVHGDELEKAARTLRDGLDRATEGTRRRLAKAAGKDDTLKPMLEEPANQKLKKELNTWAADPPPLVPPAPPQAPSWLDKLKRKLCDQ